MLTEAVAWINETEGMYREMESTTMTKRMMDKMVLLCLLLFIMTGAFVHVSMHAYAVFEDNGIDEQDLTVAQDAENGSSRDNYYERVLGRRTGNYYRNDFFDIEAILPIEWFVGSDEAVRLISNYNGEYDPAVDYGFTVPQCLEQFGHAYDLTGFTNSQEFALACVIYDTNVEPHSNFLLDGLKSSLHMPGFDPNGLSPDDLIISPTMFAGVIRNVGTVNWTWKDWNYRGIGVELSKDSFCGVLVFTGTPELTERTFNAFHTATNLEYISDPANVNEAIVQKQYLSALQNLTISAKAGNSEAIDQMMQVGVSILSSTATDDDNVRLAQAYLEMAASFGNQTAMKALCDLYEEDPNLKEEKWGTTYGSWGWHLLILGFWNDT